MLWIGIVVMPNLQVDGDPDPDGHQKGADPRADPTLSFTQDEK